VPQAQVPQAQVPQAQVPQAQVPQARQQQERRQQERRQQERRQQLARQPWMLPHPAGGPALLALLARRLRHLLAHHQQRAPARGPYTLWPDPKAATP
jgi:hypothetical protein